MSPIQDLFGRPKCLIAVVHLPPLPGSPRWGGDPREVVERALGDAAVARDAGFDGLILENFGDAPFSREFAGRGAVAGLTAAAARVVDAVDMPVGINVLRNDALSAVAVSAAVGARFVRVNVHTGAAVTDQGLIQSDAMSTMMAVRDQAPGLKVFCDVLVKHASNLGATEIERAAEDTLERGLASALIVTGDATGEPASLDDVRRIKRVLPEAPVIVGSGVNAETAAGVLEEADGIIVGSAVMKGGSAANPIDPERATTFVKAARG